MGHAPETNGSKVWTTLITNTKYLSGLFTLDYSLKKVGTKYPLVALYTDSFPPEGHKALDSRGIKKQHVPFLLPTSSKDYTNDARFHDTWSKLTIFSLTEYERIVNLDNDMLVLKNMDELMDLPLDAPSLMGTGDRVFAASHACACNPLQKPHYPKNWIPANCAFTSQHSTPEIAQTTGPSSTTGLCILNSGLLVVNPSKGIYDRITEQLDSPATLEYDFPDQDLLGDVFHGRWVALPYVYNALKTLRWEGVHDSIWRDERVKNVHYILSPKPWDELVDGRRSEIETESGKRNGRTKSDPSHEWWFSLNEERLSQERRDDLVDGF